MTPKAVHTAVGLLVLVHGLAFLFGAEDIARMGVDDLSETALAMGKGAHEIVAMFNIFLAAVLLASRTLPREAATQVLKGTTLGLVTVFLGVRYHIQSLPPAMAPPVPAAVVFGVLPLWSGYIAWGKGSGDTPSAASD